MQSLVSYASNIPGTNVCYNEPRTLRSFDSRNMAFELTVLVGRYPGAPNAFLIIHVPRLSLLADDS